MEMNASIVVATIVIIAIMEMNASIVVATTVIIATISIIIACVPIVGLLPLSW